MHVIGKPSLRYFAIRVPTGSILDPEFWTFSDGKMNAFSGQRIQNGLFSGHFSCSNIRWSIITITTSMEKHRKVIQEYIAIILDFFWTMTFMCNINIQIKLNIFLKSVQNFNCNVLQDWSRILDAVGTLKGICINKVHMHFQASIQKKSGYHCLKQYIKKAYMQQAIYNM